LKKSLQKLYPELRVLFMSGFPHVEFINRGMQDFISKPFTSQTLLARVREALKEGQSNVAIMRTAG
jgi:FixJ family two-component response regulator